jgi:uracil phosphoribosyltransferase
LERVNVVKNPALQNILLELRKRDTPSHIFCELLEQAGYLLAYEASRELPLLDESVETPLGAVATGVRVKDEDIVIVAVLRAALPMALGARRLYRRARMGFVAAKRLEETKTQAKEGIVFNVDIPYWNIRSIRGKYVLLVDPMLATGSTLSRVVELIGREKPKKIIVVGLIAVEQGVRVVLGSFDRIGVRGSIYVAAIDPELNNMGFIVPGLGDAGDRCFG